VGGLKPSAIFLCFYCPGELCWSRETASGRVTCSRRSGEPLFLVDIAPHGVLKTKPQVQSSSTTFFGNALPLIYL